MRIKVWYTRGRVFNVTTLEEWKALPAEGLLVAVWYKDTGRTIYNGGDWYWIEGDVVQYAASGDWGSDKPKPSGCSNCIKKYGVVTDTEWETLMKEVWSTKWR